MKTQTLLMLAGAIVAVTLRAANPVPLVYEPLQPTSAAPGGSGFTLTVEGTEFVNGAVVEWNGAALPTMFVSATKLTASVSSSEIATPQTATVRVVNPTPGGGTSNTVYFQVEQSQATVAFGGKNDLPPQNQEINAVVVGDFNGDGFPDLVFAVGTSTSSPGSVLIQLGNGDGTFQMPVVYSAGAACPNTLIVGDFNRDGKPDLAVLDSCSATSPSATAAILIGNGDGTFQAARLTTISDSAYVEPGALAVGDFNGDGKLDLAAVVTTGANAEEVSIFPGNGDGTFQTPINTAVGKSCCQLAPGDFNNDGKLDLVIGTWVTLLGNGDGTFKSPIPIGCPSKAFCAADVNLGNPIAADINGDGKVDIIYGSGQRPAILHGNGDGTFSNPSIYPVLAVNGVAVGDFNGDGLPDLAFLVYDYPAESSNPNGVAVLFGKGGFSFSSPVFYPSGTGNGPTLPNGLGPYTGSSPVAGPPLAFLVTADFNHDGKPDLFYTAAIQTDWTNEIRTSPPLGPYGATSFFEVLNDFVTGLSPSMVLFDTPQALGQTSSEQFVTLTNGSSSPLTISSLNITGSGAQYFAFTNTGTCPPVGQQLAANQSCTIGLTYTPPNATVETALLTISGGSAATTSAVSLIGATPILDAEITPSSGSGTSQTFTLTLTNSSIAAVWFGPPEGENCEIKYVAVDSPQITESGSGCTLGKPTITYTDSTGVDLQITLPVTFSSMNAIPIYTYVQWGQYVANGLYRGTWNDSAPQLISESSSSGQGSSWLFTLNYSDPEGATNFNDTRVLLNTSMSEASACEVIYYLASNQFYLANDAGTGLQGPPVSPGGSGTISNSQCTLSGSASSVSTSGNNLTMVVSLTFSGSFAGQKTVYM
ncbi:MAG: VCBS repeat-containing protein, partial [Acidobacteriaceae bacterium]|nr:VCBS repeat-containing protein [Acidobacteriaceae bacterium]MBV9763257.1 VCBS repeat-containing protein [Acidobacteriaceae bacterium]